MWKLNGAKSKSTILGLDMGLKSAKSLKKKIKMFKIVDSRRPTPGQNWLKVNHFLHSYLSIIIENIEY